MRLSNSLLCSLSIPAVALLSLAVARSGENNLRYSGTVVDTAGNPVSGAVVELYQDPRGFSTGEMKPQQTSNTDTNGAYEFRAPALSTIIFARQAGLAPAWNSYPVPQQNITDEKLVLAPPASITGIVVDDADKPVAEAQVRVTTAYAELGDDANRFAYLSQIPHRELFSATSGPAGEFQIEGCPTNAAVDLAVHKPGRVLRELKRDYIALDTMRCRPGQGEVKLVLERAGFVEGRVRFEANGQPVTNAIVSLQRQEHRLYSVPEPIHTGPDGSFRFDEVGTGSYRVHAAIGTNHPPEFVADTLAVNVEAGKTTRGIEIVATKGGFLQVAVVGKEDRKLMPDAHVSAFKADYQSAANAGDPGVALLRVPAGTYRVSAYQRNARSEPISATVETGTTNQVEVELPQSPKIVGTVRDPSGAPAANVDLRVVPAYRANVGPLKTDSQGRFEFPWEAQRPGRSDDTCCVVARDPKRNLAAAADLEEGITNIDLVLAPGLTIAGHVESAAGTPLNGATATLFIWRANQGNSIDDRAIKTDKKGNFEVTALPADRRYSVNVKAKGYGSGDSQIRESESETNRIDLPTFTLNVADRVLAGQILDAADKPVAGAWVNIYGRGQPNNSMRADDQGRFRFDVCEGNLRLSASVQNAYGSVSAEAGDTNVVLKIGTQSVSSQPTPRRASLKGKPLPDLAAFGLPADCAPAGKRLLVCLFDVDQRPCRRFTRLLAEQYDALRKRELSVIGLQAAVTSDDVFKEWKDAAAPPFQVGRLVERTAASKWASDMETMPWLILTDSEHRVVAEGFALEELDDLLKN